MNSTINIGSNSNSDSDSDSDLICNTVHSVCSNRLPSYMVPSVYILLKEFPESQAEWPSQS